MQGREHGLCLLQYCDKASATINNTITATTTPISFSIDEHGIIEPFEPFLGLLHIDGHGPDIPNQLDQSRLGPRRFFDITAPTETHFDYRSIAF
mmetsp:Transcript_25460/g.36245  ORF Transcript_25460/g.36245 Transcript_25460/m.36245 type:complete len:94 (-) Transcript_25460:1058-1339(-)